MTRSKVVSRTQVVLLAGIALAGGCRTAPEPAVTPATTTVTMSRGEGRGAATQDENIQADVTLNERNATRPTDIIDPHAMTRGTETCEVHFFNRTGYYINLYVDRRFRGTVAPGGNYLTYAIAGPTRVYARANFTDGSYMTWGPSMTGCPAGSHQDIPLN